MTGKVAELRALRERRHEERKNRATAKPAKSKTAKAIQTELSNIPASKSNAPAQSNSASAPFDKTAYQREYMRKRRAKAKAVT
jgi:hypothetical protein